MLNVPPGFEEGIRFKSDGKTPLAKDEVYQIAAEPPAPRVVPEEEEATVVNLMSIVKQEEDLLGLWQEETKRDEKKDKEKIVIENLEAEMEDKVCEVIPKVFNTYYSKAIALNKIRKQRSCTSLSKTSASPQI